MPTIGSQERAEAAGRGELPEVGRGSTRWVFRDGDVVYKVAWSVPHRSAMRSALIATIPSSALP